LGELEALFRGIKPTKSPVVTGLSYRHIYTLAFFHLYVCFLLTPSVRTFCYVVYGCDYESVEKWTVFSVLVSCRVSSCEMMYMHINTVFAGISVTELMSN